MMKELKDMTETELKALAYEQLINQSIATQNIKSIEQELLKRSQDKVKNEMPQV